MARTLDDYITLAVERQGLPNANRLNLLLQSSGDMVSQWKRRRAWPTDANMCKLADLAGIPRDVALLDLALWRCKDDDARDTWETLRSRLSSAAAVLIAVALLGTWGARDASASTYVQDGTGYIMETLRRWRERLFTLKPLTGLQSFAIRPPV